MLYIRISVKVRNIFADDDDDDDDDNNDNNNNLNDYNWALQPFSLEL